MFKTILTPVFGGVVLYTLLMLVVDAQQAHFTNGVIWIFRIAVIGAVILAIVNTRIRQKGLLSYRQGLLAGVAATLSMSILLSLHTLAHRTLIYPTYHEEHKAIYAGILARERDRENPEKLKWTPEQIDVQINQRWRLYFTTEGQMAISFLGAFAIGLMTTVTAAYMARSTQKSPANRKPENPNPPLNS
jgi:Protein of unknown function (DUF4199)